MIRTDLAVCYVRCPSCERVSAMAAHHLSLTLCEHCGGALPQRRQVVTIAERVALQGKGDRSRVIPLRPPASPDVR